MDDRKSGEVNGKSIKSGEDIFQSLLINVPTSHNWSETSAAQWPTLSYKEHFRTIQPGSENSDYIYKTKRKRITPSGLKETLRKCVDEKVSKSTFGCASYTVLSSAIKSPETKDTVAESEINFETHRHEKFVLGVNRSYKGSSKYKGVCFNQKKQKWRVRVSFAGKREFLGDWKTEVEAALMYDERIKQLYQGDPKLKDRLNFPEGIDSAVTEVTSSIDDD